MEVLNRYKAKVNLPGNIRKGDEFIEFINGNYMHANTDMACPYNCKNEPDFFELIQAPKYEKGSKFIIHTPLDGVEVCNAEGKRTLGTFKVPAFTNLIVEGEVKHRGKLHIVTSLEGAFPGNMYLLIPEGLKKPAEKYFFYNSEGEVHSEYIGRNIKAETFRKSIGNYHADKDGVYKHLDWLKGQNTK